MKPLSLLALLCVTAGTNAQILTDTARAAEGDKEYEDALMERLSVPPVKGDDALHWLEIANEVL
jgi:hypothetical protein